MPSDLEARVTAIEHARHSRRGWKIATAIVVTLAIFAVQWFFLALLQRIVNYQDGAKQRGTTIQLATCAVLINSPTQHDIGVELCDDPHLVEQLKALGVDPAAPPPR